MKLVTYKYEESMVKSKKSPMGVGDDDSNYNH